MGPSLEKFVPVLTVADSVTRNCFGLDDQKLWAADHVWVFQQPNPTSRWEGGSLRLCQNIDASCVWTNSPA